MKNPTFNGTLHHKIGSLGFDSDEIIFPVSLSKPNKYIVPIFFNEVIVFMAACYPASMCLENINDVYTVTKTPCAFIQYWHSLQCTIIFTRIHSTYVQLGTTNLTMYKLFVALNFHLLIGRTN